MSPNANLPGGESKRPTAYVHLAYGLDAERYRRRHAEGLEPDESPYGFHLAREQGFAVSFPRDAPRNPRGLLLRIFRRLLQLDILHAFANRDRIRAADIVWTMTDTDALAVAFLFALRLTPRRPVIANSVWLFARWPAMPGYRRAAYRLLARYFTILTVHSKLCLPLAREIFPRLHSQLMYFGINTDSYRLTPPAPRDAAPIRIFAAGSDQTRDWATLLAAFGNDPRFVVTIICEWLDEGPVPGCGNATVVRAPTVEEFRRCYAEADVVAVPMVDNIYSGITVALEAVALGKPLLATRTGGVTTYFDEEDAIFVAPGDPTTMREAVLATDAAERRTRAERAQRHFLANDYSARAVVRRYAQLSRELLDA